MVEQGNTVAPEVDFDHHTPEYADNWPELTAQLRAKCPVTHTSAWGGFYVATTYEHVGEVVRDDERFSSEHEVEGFEAPYTLGITIPASPNGSIPIDLDPPRNKPYRKLLDPLFSPKASARWEPFLRDAVTACIDSFIESGEGDIVYDLANPIPALLTCKLMGLPVEDWHIYADPMHEIVYTPPGTPEYEEIQQQVNLMLGKIFEAVQARKSEPQDDLITLLVQAEIEDAPIPDDIIMQILFLVLVGGVDTTTSVMANALRWLSQHPEERDRLRQDPTLLQTAREEMLRYFTPTQGLARTCTRDTDLAGVPLSLGDRVFMSFAAANRDPAVFPDPDAMVLDRTPNPHTTFGMGVHRCLGSNIARVEFDVVISEVLRRLPDFVVDEAGSKRYDTVGVVNGWQRMPMTFTPGEPEGASFTFKR